MARSQYAPRAEYVGAGNLSAYTFDFKITSLDQLKIGVFTDLFVKTFEVDGNDTTYLTSVTYDAVNGGGTVNLVTNLPSNHSLCILLANDEPTQDSEFKNKGDFTLERFESALDEIDGQVQRLAYLSKRSFKLWDGFKDTETFNTELPISTTVVANQNNENKVLIVNSTNDGIGLGPSVTDLTSTAADAVAAAAAAAISATSAATSATNAANSAIAAAASAAQVAISVYGTYAAPKVIAAAVGLSVAAVNMNLTAQEQRVFVGGPGVGNTDITNNPQIQAGVIVGARMYLVGADDTNWITFSDGNGIRLNGPWVSKLKNSLSLFWDGSVWAEDARRQ